MKLLSQNLVPNPGFELYSSCPNNTGQITNAIPWFQPYTSGSSTDFFNACYLGPLVSVPYNIIGMQIGNNGFGYAGFQSWSENMNIREYLEIELTDSLLNSEQYCISFYVSLPEGVKFGCDGVGAYFSNAPVFYSSPFFGVLNFQPQFQNTSGNIIIDTINWILVKGSFIASGGEKYITIGNFRNDSLTNTVAVDSSGFQASYFYIDDVSVVQGGCNVGLADISDEKENILVFPNPTNGIVHLENVEDGLVELFDSSGRRLMLAKNKNVLNLTAFSDGIYFIKFTFVDESVVYKRIVVNK